MNQDPVTLGRKSYDHILRTRDRALHEAEWAREDAERARHWASTERDEARRLEDRLCRVIAAAASMGVTIDAINAALEDGQ